MAPRFSGTIEMVMLHKQLFVCGDGGGSRGVKGRGEGVDAREGLLTL